MKTSAVLTSLLFGSFAAAAPFDKRALVYKTEIVTETVVVYTTVWDDDEPVAQATTTPAGYFYEQPKAPSSAAAKVTPTPQAPAVEKPSAAPVVQEPTTTPSPSPVPAPAPSSAPSSAPAPVVEQATPTPVAEPQPTTEAPQPTTTTSAYVAPPAYTEAPAAPAPSPSAPSSGSPSTGGMTYNGDITIYDNTGALGACGTPLHDSDMIVALSKDTWGASTYDVMTGAATNPWCNQKIKIEYKGNSIEATIMDMCPGCSGADIDLSLSAWKALTGLDEKTRLKASWSKIS